MNEESSQPAQPSLFDASSYGDQHENGGHDSQAEKAEKRRQRLLDRLSTHQLNTLEARVGYLLANYPETRNSDITLQLQYWAEFEPDKIKGEYVHFSQLYDLARLTTLNRTRATIQNTYGLFQATDHKVAARRQQLADEHKKEYGAVVVAPKDIVVYADESGKQGTDPYFLVGSVWSLSVSEANRINDLVKEYRKEKGIKSELHFSKTGRQQIDKYIPFLEEYVIKNGYLGFKALSVENSGFPDRAEAFTQLFAFLLQRGIEHEHNTGRAPLPRRVFFMKDADEAGSDAIMLANIAERMKYANKSVFDGKLVFHAEDPISSKVDFMIQIADFFTACLNRKINTLDAALEKDSNYQLHWKDEVSTWFLKEVQFQMDTTAALSDRAVRLSLLSPTLRPEEKPVFITPQKTDAVKPSKPNGSEQEDGEVAPIPSISVREEDA